MPKIKTSICKQQEMVLTQADVVLLIRRIFRDEYSRRGFAGVPALEDISVDFNAGMNRDFAVARVITKEETE